MNASSNYALNVATRGGWGQLTLSEQEEVKALLSSVPRTAGESLTSLILWLKTPAVRLERGWETLVKLLNLSRDAETSTTAQGGPNAH